MERFCDDGSRDHLADRRASGGCSGPNTTEQPAARAAAIRCSIRGRPARTCPVSAISPTKAAPRAGVDLRSRRGERGRHRQVARGVIDPDPAADGPDRAPTCRAGARSHARQDRRDLLEAPEVESGHLPPARTLVGPDERLDLDRERPPARERQRDGGPRMAFPGDTAGLDGSIGESPAASHLEPRGLALGPETVLAARYDAEARPGVAFEGEHDVNRVLQRARAGEVAILGDVSGHRRPSRRRSWQARRGRRRTLAPARPLPAAWRRPGREATGSNPPRARPGAGRAAARTSRGRGPARRTSVGRHADPPAARGHLAARLLARREQAGTPLAGHRRASHWSSRVDLPMPGGPAKRITEPGTRPPPSTRSRSGRPVSRRTGSEAPGSISGTTASGCRPDLGAAARRVAP